MPVAQAGEVRLDYERSGSGPPLLLIMGMSGTKEHWGRPFLEALRQSFEVEMPTSIVHGTADRMLPVGNVSVIASLIHHARLEVMEGVGRLFSWERPERSARLVRGHALGSGVGGAVR